MTQRQDQFRAKPLRPGDTGLKLELPRDAAHISIGRFCISEAVRAADQPHLAETAALLGCELMTHVVLHGAGSVFEVDVTWAEPALRVTIYDPAWMTSDPPAMGESSQLLDQLAATWGRIATRDGTILWFEL